MKKKKKKKKKKMKNMKKKKTEEENDETNEHDDADGEEDETNEHDDADDADDEDDDADDEYEYDDDDDDEDDEDENEDEDEEEETYIINHHNKMIHHEQHFPSVFTTKLRHLAPAGRPEQLRRGPAAELRGPAVDDVLPENGDEGNPGCRLFVGARLALRHCRLGPSGGDSLIEKD